jgi:drug/metabolite transporter (DMT)-like permease
VAPARGPAPADPITWAFFVGLALVWGSSFLFIKIGLGEGLPPFTLVTFRLAIAAAFLLVLLALTGGRVPRDRQGLLPLATLAVINIAIPFVLLNWGAQYIPSAITSVFNGTVPLFAIVLASLLLHDEPVTVDRLGGLLLGFAGALLLASPGLGSGMSDEDAVMALLGEAAVAAAAFSYAAGAVYARRAITGRRLFPDGTGGHRVGGALEISAAQVMLALPMTATLALALERPADGLLVVPPTSAAWFSVLWLGVLGSGVAYLLFFRLVRSWGATRTSLVSYVMPVVGIALGVIVLGETLHPVEIVGAALIISGVVIANSGRGRRRLFGRAPMPGGASR